MEQIKLALRHVIGGSSRRFAETLYNEYLESGDYSNIDCVVTAVTSNLGRALFSASSQGNEGTDIAQKLRVVIRALQDLLHNVTEGNDVSDLRGCIEEATFAHLRWVSLPLEAS